MLNIDFHTVKRGFFRNDSLSRHPKDSRTTHTHKTLSLFGILFIFFDDGLRFIDLVLFYSNVYRVCGYYAKKRIKKRMETMHTYRDNHDPHKLT